MNSTAVKEAVATGYPRDKMYGVWWAGAEPDVKDVGDGAKGYHALALQHGAEPNSKIVQEILKEVHAKGQGTGPKEEVGQVLYMRGLMAAMLAVEGVKRAQERFGKGKVMTGEQARWGYENLALDQKKLDALGFAGVMRPISTSCADHAARRGHASTPGTAASGSSPPTGTRPISRSSSRWSRRRPTSTRRRRRSRAARSRTASPTLRKADRTGTLPSRARPSGRAACHHYHACHPTAHPAQRQWHRGHLQPRDPRAEGRVVAGARGQHRGAARRQRRRQDDDAARREQPAGRRARRGHQGLDRAARRAHREAVAPPTWSTAAWCR